MLLSSRATDCHSCLTRNTASSGPSLFHPPHSALVQASVILPPLSALCMATVGAREWEMGRGEPERRSSDSEGSGREEEGFEMI